MMIVARELVAQDREEVRAYSRQFDSGRDTSPSVERPSVEVIAPRRSGNPTSMPGDYLTSKIDRICQKRSREHLPPRPAFQSGNIPPLSRYRVKNLIVIRFRIRLTHCTGLIKFSL